MTTTKVIIISIITALVVSLAIGGLVLHQASQTGQTFGTQVQNDLWYFTGGVRIGTQSNSSLKEVQFNADIIGTVVLGPMYSTTSTVVGTAQISDPNFALGDPCLIGDTMINTASGTFAAFSGQVTATTTGSSTVTYSITNQTTTLQTIPTSTLKITCIRN